MSLNNITKLYFASICCDKIATILNCFFCGYCLKFILPVSKQAIVFYSTSSKSVGVSVFL